MNEIDTEKMINWKAKHNDCGGNNCKFTIKAKIMRIVKSDQCNWIVRKLKDDKCHFYDKGIYAKKRILRKIK